MRTNKHTQTFHSAGHLFRCAWPVAEYTYVEWIPSCSERFRWTCKAGSDWANRPGLSPLHRWGRPQRTRSCTHTCTWGRWSGWDRCTQHVCCSCESCLYRGSLARKPVGKGEREIKKERERESIYWLNSTVLLHGDRYTSISIWESGA